jgi:hypothetical protein
MIMVFNFFEKVEQKFIKGYVMKAGMRNSFFLMPVLGIFVGVSFAASPTVEVGTWGNFAKGAISHTFDDYPYTGTLQQVGSGQEAFDAKKLHMTLFVITKSVTDWTKLNDAFKKGHEIASHTQTHGSNASELGPSQQDIKKNVPGEMCVSLAYPNGTTIAGALQTYIAARTIQGRTNAKTPGDFSQIATQGVGMGSGNYETVVTNESTDMNKLADEAASGNKWATAMHHGIGGSSDPKHSWAFTDVGEMAKHLDYLDKNRSKIWCETFGNVARYIKEREAAKVTVKSSDAKSVTVTLTDNLADSIYNFPLSLRFECPTGWTESTAKQGTKVMPDTIITDATSSKKYVMFQAVPNKGDVIVSSGKDDTSVAMERFFGFGSNQVSPVKRLHGELIIDQSQFSGPGAAVTLFNLQGKELARYNLSGSASRVTLPIDKINRSALIVRISSANKSYVCTVLPQS